LGEGLDAVGDGLAAEGEAAGGADGGAAVAGPLVPTAEAALAAGVTCSAPPDPAACHAT
jgi:hypothetical protein